MAIGLRCIGVDYSLSNQFVTVTMTFELYDDTILDETGVPKTLDQKTVSVQQNVLDPNALNNLKSKIQDELQDYLTKAKVNIDTLVSQFGTPDPDAILTVIKQDVEADIPNLITAIFG